ncbi:MAG: thioredoxin family protein [Candidatus Thorarchaeota archaeon]|jgi:thiol-disulfide isomerase/thioredoxin
MVDLNDIRSRTTNARGYLDQLKEKYKDIILDAYKEYELDSGVVDELKDIIKGMTVVVFSAAWCGDCTRAIPVMMHLEEQLDLEVMAFSKIKTAPLDPNRQWAVPPSPPEVNEWGATAIPYFVFFDSGGNKVATITEKPKVKDTLEAEILHVLKNK